MPAISTSLKPRLLSDANDPIHSFNNSQILFHSPHVSGYSFCVIALLDYGSANLRSVEKALKKVRADVLVTQSPSGNAGARGLLLPGVGALDDCVHAMRRQLLLNA